MEVSDHPGEHEPGEPEFEYTANIHGNEAVGRSLVLNLLTLLCENYGKDPLITSLVDFSRIHLIPSMNPDGFGKALNASEAKFGDRGSTYGRRNDHDVDLNRNFPYANTMKYTYAEPETRAVMDWLRKYPFVLAGDLHGGNLVADYPFDVGPESETYNPTPDDDTFRWLAESYSLAHLKMHTGHPCPQKSEVFEKGILNGASYYGHPGVMQDWNYLHTNCLQIAVELGCTKYPDPSDLPKYWEDHKYSLLVFMAQVHRGMKGFVVNTDSGEGIAGAEVHVTNISHVIKTAESGDYWRLLTPGSYTVTVVKTGYIGSTQEVTVTEGAATIINFRITKTAQSDWIFPRNQIIPAILSIVTFVVLVVGSIIVWKILACRRRNPRMVSLLELPQYPSKWCTACRNCNPCCRKKQREISLTDYSAAVRLLTIDSEGSEEDEFSIPLRYVTSPSEGSIDEL